MHVSGVKLENEARRDAEDAAKGVRRFVNLAAQRKRDERLKAAAKARRK